MRAVVLVLVVLLSGCALPPVLAIASYVADGAVYVATGKTATDHGLSVLTGEDCKVWRALDGDQVCLRGPELTMASVRPLPESE